MVIFDDLRLNAKNAKKYSMPNQSLTDEFLRNVIVENILNNVNLDSATLKDIRRNTEKYLKLEQDSLKERKQLFVDVILNSIQEKAVATNPVCTQDVNCNDPRLQDFKQLSKMAKVCAKGPAIYKGLRDLDMQEKCDVLLSR